ncbi:helix-turn-helix domain-containing protein [Chitinophaga sp. Hz27]|uniref:helix-turn-helix domain-containing protein n=1 Tax=Chitinophaga sp. Hz27 TaxID=3347169 RepID=UPI0035D7061C
MKKLMALSGHCLLEISSGEKNPFPRSKRLPEYLVLLVHEGSGAWQADFATCHFEGPAILFATPLQAVQIKSSGPISWSLIQFHSDFYCIEAHHDEVACNGLLFNNIYKDPAINLTTVFHSSFKQIFDQMAAEFDNKTPSDIVLRAYLQLVLAKSSTHKIREEKEVASAGRKDAKMEAFRKLLDKHFLQLHKPAEYADLLAMTPNALSKKSIGYFGKTPSQLIQERIILEAKKLLHLTQLSIKEIAFRLEFSDEYYFSRYFKKAVKESPQSFRKKVGISEVAYSSM